MATAVSSDGKLAPGLRNSIFQNHLKILLSPHGILAGTQPEALNLPEKKTSNSRRAPRPGAAPAARALFPKAAGWPQLTSTSRKAASTSGCAALRHLPVRPPAGPPGPPVRHAHAYICACAALRTINCSAPPPLPRHGRMCSCGPSAAFHLTSY